MEIHIALGFRYISADPFSHQAPSVQPDWQTVTDWCPLYRHFQIRITEKAVLIG